MGCECAILPIAEQQDTGNSTHTDVMAVVQSQAMPPTTNGRGDQLLSSVTGALQQHLNNLANGRNLVHMDDKRCWWSAIL